MNPWETFSAIRYLDFAPASQLRPSDRTGHDQAAPGEATHSTSPGFLSPETIEHGLASQRAAKNWMAPEFVDWQQNRINVLCRELERCSQEIAYLRTRHDYDDKAVRTWRGVAIALAGIGIVLCIARG